MNFYFIGRACRASPPDGKGCRYWTYLPEQNISLPISEQTRTCFLLNSCANLTVSNPEIVSGDRDCDPLDAILALGETLDKNIVALKGAKTALEGYNGKRRKRDAASDCTELTVFVNQRKFFLTNNIIFRQTVDFCT